MRELYFTIDEFKGLRRKERGFRNSQYATDLLNAKVGELRLEPFEPAGNPFDPVHSDYFPFGNPHGEAIDWPMPQMFAFTEHVLLATRQRLYEVHPTNWTKTAVGHAVYTPDFWDFADFHDFIIGTNGEAIFLRQSQSGNWSVIWAAAEIPCFKTVCNFNGQIVVGNTWNWHTSGPNFVAWSRIGSANFVLDESNEAGLRPVHWKGQVLRVLQLGGGVVVYGDNGIGMLVPKDQVFGYQPVAGYGIAGGLAVAGSESRHVFVRKDGMLCSAEAQTNALGGHSLPKISELGFVEFFETQPVVSAYTEAPSTDVPDYERDVVVAHDPGLEEFWISDGATSYLLTKYGLSRTGQCATSLGRWNNQLIGPARSMTSQEFLWVSDVMDFRLRGRKSIETIEIAGSAGLSVAVDWRNSPSDSFETTDWTKLNDQGWARHPISGVELRLRVKADAYAGAMIDSITARYKLTDLRSIRGIYAPPPRGQNAD